jgi:very-short-patch-repair endonuclease
MTITFDGRVATVAARNHGLITSADVAALGGSRETISNRLADGRWCRVAQGVYRLGGMPATRRQRFLGAVLAGGEGSVLSHGSAAALFGLPGFGGGPVEITRPRGRSQRRPDQRTHGSLWLPPRHVTARHGIPVTTPARTLFDLAGWFHPDRVARAFDTALSMELVTPEAAAATSAELGRRGRRGTRVMRRLCAERGVGYVATASELEALLAGVLAAAGLPLPRRQVDVGDGEGWVGRVDFLFTSARLVIEADGRRWHTAKTDLDADRQRDNRLAASGWRILRVTWEQLVNRPWEVVALVSNALAAVAA